MTFVATTRGGASMSASAFVVKQCGAAESHCAACGSCIARGTCTCSSGGTEGGVCSRVVPPTISAAAERKWTTDRVTVMTWNVLGVRAVTRERTQAIASSVLASTANIVALQEVFTADMAELLQRAFAQDLPHMSHRSFGNGPNTVSGLFLASQFPVVDEAFEEFTTSTGDDSFVDKGIYSALIKARSMHMLVVAVLGLFMRWLLCASPPRFPSPLFAGSGWDTHLALQHAYTGHHLCEHLLCSGATA